MVIDAAVHASAGSLRRHRECARPEEQQLLQLYLGEVALQHVPEELDHAVRRAVPARVAHEGAQLLEVDGRGAAQVVAQVDGVQEDEVVRGDDAPQSAPNSPDNNSGS